MPARRGLALLGLAAAKVLGKLGLERKDDLVGRGDGRGRWALAKSQVRE